MGDRGEVNIGGVSLYTHWGASSLIEDVKTALNERARWGDEEYLARIIFCKIVGDDFNGTTGYGIGIITHSDARISINIKDEHIEVAKDGKTTFKGTFEDFLADDTI